jgi:hypothetical protein
MYGSVFSRAISGKCYINGTFGLKKNKYESIVWAAVLAGKNVNSAGRRRMIGLHRQSRRWGGVDKTEALLRVWSRTNVEGHKGAAAVCWTGAHVFSNGRLKQSHLHLQAQLQQATTFAKQKYLLKRAVASGQAPPFLERRVKSRGIVLNLIQEGGDHENVRRHQKGKRKVYS